MPNYGKRLKGQGKGVISVPKIEMSKIKNVDYFERRGHIWLRNSDI